MATIVNTATSSAMEAPHIDTSAMSSYNGTTPEPQVNSSPQSMRDTKYRHVFATHSQNRLSCLTFGARQPASFVGFRNLMIILIVFSNLRLMIENFRKYGVLICLSCHDYSRQDVTYGLALYFSIPFQLFIAYLIELIAARQANNAVGRMKRAGEEHDTPENQAAARRSFKKIWKIVALCHSANATINLLGCSYIVYYWIHHPGIGTLCELHAVVVWLKACSYAFTNRDLRHALLHPGQAKEPLPEIYATCPYPRNITFSNLCYFWWAPTLVYQPAYPRTDKVRYGYVAMRALEVFGLSIAIWIASAQYAAPLLQNSLDKMATLDFAGISERVMKLSTVSLFCWLCGFYALFHSSLNGLAEIMRFADREFYGPWWNVSSVREYWTTWNKPVTNFMRRHIYSPLVGRGWPPALAQIVVFFISAVLHELLVGIPTHNILGVAFMGMMFQIPLIVFTDTLKKIKGIRGDVAGNMIFWMSFCFVGQPLAALLYFFAWHAKYGVVYMGWLFDPPWMFILKVVGLCIMGTWKYALAVLSHERAPGLFDIGA